MTAPAHSTLPAKNPANPLAGPYGHPAHPVAVMVPIGAWVSSLTLDLLSRASRGRKSEGYARSSRALIGVGLLGAGGAALTGLLDYTTIPRGTRVKKFATVHLLMNVTAITSYGLNFMRRDPDERVTDGAFRLSLVTVSALGVSGIIGGELVYRYGVRVADERTQARGFEGAEAADPYVTEGVHMAGNVTARQGIDPY